MILLCVLISVATAQMTTLTESETRSWQIEVVKYKGDEWAHFQPSEKRFQYNDHEWVDGIAETYLEAEFGEWLLRERICKNCLRWEIVIWRSSGSSNLDSTLTKANTAIPFGIGFEALMGRIEKRIK